MTRCRTELSGDARCRVGWDRLYRGAPTSGVQRCTECTRHGNTAALGRCGAAGCSVSTNILPAPAPHLQHLHLPPQLGLSVTGLETSPRPELSCQSRPYLQGCQCQWAGGAAPLQLTGCSGRPGPVGGRRRGCTAGRPTGQRGPN